MRFEIFRNNGVILSPDFWDCQCVDNFIHRKQSERVCGICGAEEGESPDSRIDEILTLFPEILTEQERADIIHEMQKEALERGASLVKLISTC